jgi:signal transduction histidine kinase
MKRASWVCSEACRCAALAAGLLILLCACSEAPRSNAFYQRFSQAQAAMQLLPRLPEAQTGMPDVSPLSWHEVPLPGYAPRLQYSADLPWRRYWLKAEFTVASAPPEGLDLYVSSGGYLELDAFCNGQRLGGTSLAIDQPGRFPFRAHIPGSFLRDGSNVVHIALSGRGTALAPVFAVADPDSAKALYKARMWAVAWGPQCAAILTGFISLVAFGFWLGRRHETVYLFMALAGVMWVLRASVHFFEILPINTHAMWWLVLNALPWAMAFSYLFVLRSMSRKAPLLERGLIGMAILLSLMSLPLRDADLFWRYQIANAGLEVFAVVCTAFILRFAWKVRTAPMVLLAGSLVINLCIGVHDYLCDTNYRYLDGEGVYLMPFGALFTYVAVAYGALRRAHATLDELEMLNRTLEVRVEEKATELESTYRLLATVEREKAAADERGRLMREMHDGMGSSLMTSLKMVERGEMGSEEIAVMLRECLDDLRLIIDSLEPVDHDLVALLAALRYRLGQRLQKAGVTLEWQVADLPPLPYLDANAALQIMRVLQEAMTNALKHAHATTIRMQTGLDPVPGARRVFVRLQDDGAGFDVQQQFDLGSGRGLRNLHRRAAAVGGTLDIRSGPGGTSVTLWLPIDAPSQGLPKPV